MGALTILDISANKLCNGTFGMDDLGPAIANSKITSLNVSGNSLGLNRGIEHISNIMDKGALSCEDGRYYHEWTLNTAFIEDPSGVGNKVEILSPSEQVRQCTITDRDSTKFKIHYDGYDAEHDEWVDINSPRVNLTTYQRHKYVSCAPDVGGQDQEPDGPLNTSVCLHCNKPKGHHSGKGAMRSLSLASNYLGVAGAKIIAAVLPMCT
jgi:hypothetical protein